MLQQTSVQFQANSPSLTLLARSYPCAKCERRASTTNPRLSYAMGCTQYPKMEGVKRNNAPFNSSLRSVSATTRFVINSPASSWASGVSISPGSVTLRSTSFMFAFVIPTYNVSNDESRHVLGQQCLRKRKLNAPGSLTMTGDDSIMRSALKPVSSTSSRIAASSADSPSSMRPAGNSVDISAGITQGTKKMERNGFKLNRKTHQRQRRQ